MVGRFRYFLSLVGGHFINFTTISSIMIVIMDIIALTRIILYLSVYCPPTSHALPMATDGWPELQKDPEVLYIAELYKCSPLIMHNFDWL